MMMVKIISDEAVRATGGRLYENQNIRIRIPGRVKLIIRNKEPVPWLKLQENVKNVFFSYLHKTSKCLKMRIELLTLSTALLIQDSVKKSIRKPGVI